MVKKNNIKKKYPCPKCHKDMMYFFADTAEEWSEGYGCSGCKKEIITDRIIKIKVKTTKNTYRSRVVDTSMPVIDWSIPKLEDRFYYVHDINHGRKYYNPVLNLLRTEVKITNPAKQIEMITQITQHKLARQIRKDIGVSQSSE